MFRQSKTSAFTLIELLVVIAIIAILVGILMPSLMQAKVMAKRTSCTANLHSIGLAAAIYDSEYGGYVPMGLRNYPSSYKNPTQSWRANLLPYVSSYIVFNCPSETGTGAEIFDSAAEVTTTLSKMPVTVNGVTFEKKAAATANSGTYGILYIQSFASVNAIDFDGNITDTYDYDGNPDPGHAAPWYGTVAFPTAPGKGWADPGNSVYAADCCFQSAPYVYPTVGNYPGRGSAYIVAPSDPDMPDNVKSRRFADRHAGTNCLFLSGHVKTYVTRVLDQMKFRAPECIWDMD